jgi:hypothetical protein
LRKQLATWCVGGEIAEAAVLVLSELATNAVCATAAGCRTFDVRFELAGYQLRVEVADGGQGRPSPRRAGGDDECGRGLALVEALADRWGTEPLRLVGKTVWAQWHLLPSGTLGQSHVPPSDVEFPMTHDNPPPASAEILHEAERVHRELTAALRSAGIVLPSLRVSTLTYAEDAPRPLIELGGCNLPTARALAAALRTQPTGTTSADTDDRP